MESQEIAAFKAFCKNIVTQILMLVIGVWLGSLLALLSEKVFNYFKRSNLHKALNNKDYNMVINILEEQIVNNQKRELSSSISKMIKHFGFNDQSFKNPMQSMDKIVVCIHAFTDNKSLAEQLIRNTRRVIIRDYIEYLKNWINKRHESSPDKGLLIKIYHAIAFILTAHCDGNMKAAEFCILQSMQFSFKLLELDREVHEILNNIINIQNLNEKTVLQNKDQLIKSIQNYFKDEKEQEQLLDTVLFTIVIDARITLNELKIIDEIACNWDINKWKKQAKKNLMESGSLILDENDKPINTLDYYDSKSGSFFN